MSFALPEACVARVAVFGLRGERVRVLADGMRAAGAHALEWHGEDDAGRSVAPGAYFVRLETARRNETRRFVWLR